MQPHSSSSLVLYPIDSMVCTNFVWDECPFWWSLFSARDNCWFLLAREGMIVLFLFNSDLLLESWVLVPDLDLIVSDFPFFQVLNSGLSGPAYPECPDLGVFSNFILWYTESRHNAWYCRLCVSYGCDLYVSYCSILFVLYCCCCW